MKWISAKEVPPIFREMLVVCKKCNHVHAVFWDYNSYQIPEWCDELSGPMAPGGEIKFDWYMPLPEPPKQDS